MLYTEETVKDNIRNKDGKRVFYLGKGDTLTPGGRDWLRQQRIEILNADMAKPSEYRLLNGGVVKEKYEHMTHLNSQILVCKTHPRIIFRGSMDNLEAQIILAQGNCDRKIASMLSEVLSLAREIIRCDVLETPLERERLCGMTEAEIRERSHRPQDFYKQPHFMPEYTDGEAVTYLNIARCAARDAEIKAVAAFSDREGNPVRIDILKALNRMSSMLYILMIMVKSGENI